MEGLVVTVVASNSGVRADAILADDSAGVRSVDHLVVADGDTDVNDVTSGVGEEDEIARLRGRDAGAQGGLVRGSTTAEKIATVRQRINPSRKT